MILGPACIIRLAVVLFQSSFDDALMESGQYGWTNSATCRRHDGVLRSTGVNLLVYRRNWKHFKERISTRLVYIIFPLRGWPICPGSACQRWDHSTNPRALMKAPSPAES